MSKRISKSYKWANGLSLFLLVFVGAFITPSIWIYAESSTNWLIQTMHPYITITMILIGWGIGLKIWYDNLKGLNED